MDPATIPFFVSSHTSLQYATGFSRLFFKDMGSRFWWLFFKCLESDLLQTLAHTIIQQADLQMKSFTGLNTGAIL